jgi:hypothetical protein
MELMATGSRTLKLSILAETKQLVDGLKSAEKDTQSFGDKIEGVGKKVGLAFAAAAAAAAAYAVKIGIDGVKSAIEDEAAQLRLASALRTATGATDVQIKATEDYISKTQLATGITDNDLRASFQRLAVTTKDTAKSQDILNLAIDVSKGTGKDLSVVTEALAKAYEGNDAKLAKLGIGLTATQLKTMDFKGTTEALSDLYGGAAARNAETFQGRIDRLKQAFDEGKESIGVALLPILEKMIGYIFEYGVPIFNKFKDAWNVVADAIERNKDKFSEFIQLLQTYVLPILGTVFSKITEFAANAVAFIIDVFGTIAGVVTPIVNFIIDNINRVIRGLNLIKPGADIAYLNQMGSAAATNVGGYGDIPSSGSSAGTSGSSAGGSSGGSSGGIGGGAGGSGSSGAIGNAAAAVNLPDLVRKLQGVSDKIAETTFLLATDAITSKSAQTSLNALQKQFNILSKQADAALGLENIAMPPMTTNPLAGSYYGQTGRDAPIINLTVNGAIDSEGTARTIVQNLNDSYDRGTGGANNFNTTGTFSRFG